MDPIDVGDISDLRIRLEVIAEEADRRLVTVFGSGISSAVLPGVPELTQIFRDHVPKRGRAKFDETITPINDPGLKYQNAAALLTKQAGESFVMRAIRTAVLRACRDVAEEDVAKVARDEELCRAYVKSGNWQIPLGYQRFARFFAALSGKVRGPIITTNFDPLIEIALREAGVDAVPIPVPTDSAPTPEQLREAVTQPVLHIHGYWTGPATSNVPSRITADRPKLDLVLQELLRNSVVLVVGYSGWLDGFMKSLRSRVLNEADLLQAEVLWAAYETDAAAVVGDGVLKELAAAPGFSLYLGVDGHELFTGELDRDETEADETSSPFGYSRVPRRPVAVASYVPGAFAEGRQPVWADAEPGRWPALSTAVTLEERVLKWLDGGGGGGAVAIGPLGEGKSLALRQVALSVAASRTEWNVLWREPGAPPITEAWLNEIRSGGQTLVCVDEADLIMDDLVTTHDVWTAEGSGIVFLLASHDRLWWQGAGTYLKRWIDDILFHGITGDDARNIAAAWQRMGLLPNALQNVEVAAKRLASSAGVMAAESNTLFGAVLDVRYGPELGSRVEDLLRKLREIKLTDSVDLSDVFAGICVMQHTLDKDGNLSRGASRPVIAAMVGLDAVFADGKILKTLGHEAAVTFAGNRVYCRHPAIASTVVDYLHREGPAQKVYELVGQAGGALMEAGASDVDGYRDAYLISRVLPAPEAVWAATGAVKGTGSGVLESRVSLLRALRLEGRHRSVAYARELAPRVRDYRDFHRAVRGFLVEFSISLRDDGHAQTSAGLAALALDDRVGFTLDSVRAGYALVSLAKSAAGLNAQTGDGVTMDAPEVCYVLLGRIRSEKEAARYLNQLRLKQLDDFQQLPAGKLCGRLATMLHKAATSALQEMEIPIELHDMLSFDNLRRLAEQRRGRA
ncbi:MULTISPECIES: P-loop NTPase [Streptomyces]|uniref:P-loop NTPase n=1 Tax=Streptomyces TaxID=1883 RepID=UPI001C307396|nr:SIR2 family protein [Streptomyces sp. GbtcB7]